MKMRTLNLFTFAVMLTVCSATAWGVPAHPGKRTVFQPDGSTVTLAQYGDEYLNYTTTSDGYTVLKDDSGFYVYANLINNSLVKTTQIAHDLSDRNPAEKQFLSGLEKRLHPSISGNSEFQRNVERASRREARQKLSGSRYDYSQFRGLIVLVEYNDCQFSRDDYFDIISDMICKPGYSGYTSAGRNPEWVECTGSVYDYYFDNSMGIFQPSFDIIGPVKVNRSMYFVCQAVNSVQLIGDVLTAIDSQVNFADYDTDGDGIVDMVYFIFAGPGSHYTGNDSRLLWPHSANYSNFTPRYMDGVKMGRYACSTELANNPDDNRLEGIGTICHEFSHVLGLEDLYDTDGSGSGGTSEMTPELWSLMDAGCYIDDSKTPAGYSLYERYQIGFAEPKTITEEGEYSLDPLDTSNEGYILESGRANEFFAIENRQRIKWNKVNPGHGMLVYRVDRTNENAWIGNYINCDPTHNYYQLLRATNQKYDYTGTPFPGTGNCTALNNNTSPSVQAWNGVDAPLVLKNIRENEDGTVSFSVIDSEKSAGVISIENTADNAPTTYYDLTGQLIKGIPDRAGIYIQIRGAEHKKVIIP